MSLSLKRLRVALALISILLMGISLIVLASMGQMITVCRAAEISGTKPVTEFSVVSYNIQARPVLDPCSEKAPLIGEKLRTFDLIGLQEAFSCAEELFHSAQPLHSAYFGRRRHPFKLVNSGLAVLTRFPMTKSHARYFEDEGSLENRLGSKGLLLSRIDINGAPLDFYTTHLAAGEGQAPLPSKLQELKQIIGFIGDHSPDDHAVILCGDFNLRLKDLKPLTDAGLLNAATDLRRDKDSFIDHIYYRPSRKLPLKPAAWEVLKKGFAFPDGKPLSDHAPLKVLFRLP